MPFNAVGPAVGPMGIATEAFMDALRQRDIAKMKQSNLEGISGQIVAAAEQPPDNLEWIEADDIFIKRMVIAKAGTLIPQHSHVWDHVSMVAAGGVRIWRDGKLGEIVMAPKPIFIAKGVEHTFQSLVDGTIIDCIHNLHGEQAVAVLQEHQLID